MDLVDLVVLIASIITMLAGITQINDSSPKSQETIKKIFGFALVIAPAAFIAFFFYFGPKSTIDTYLQELQEVDAVGLRNTICTDSPLYATYQNASPMIGLGGLLGLSITIQNYGFNPLERSASFELVTGSAFSTPTVSGIGKVYAESRGLTHFCIARDNIENVTR
ncbi:MAG: hypothetical protein KJ065_04830 [Anaerolineae bacterium]|nr:hypothetical protein [Anaerolineae bacterium]